MTIHDSSEIIRDFVIKKIRNQKKDITKIISERFNISRQAAHRHIKKMVDEGLISQTGNTKARVYEIKQILKKEFVYQIKTSTDEDKVWREDFADLLRNISKNVYEICHYGFTEIFNNALSHSEGTTITASIIYWPDLIRIIIHDNGIGVFNKIAKIYNLDDPLHAILELSKGKLSTDPESHSGQGIFYTSRIFDKFCIFSSNYIFTHLGTKFDLMYEDQKPTIGTDVLMEISPNSKKTTQKIFNLYTTDVDEYNFDKTLVPVFLARYGDDNLISRSQAKRLLARFDRFKEVVLDFDKVNMIGQAFADEIFRVFKNNHPLISINSINANDEIKKMIKRVQFN